EAGQLVADLDGRIIAQLQVGTAALFGEEVDDQEDVGRLFLDGDAAALDQLGQDGLGQGLTVLHEHLGDVQVGAGLERDRQRVAAVVGTLRGHVHHALDAVDLLLDGRGHGVGDDLGVGAGVGRRHLDGGRRDFRVLRYRQREEGDAAGEYDHDRQHRG